MSRVDDVLCLDTPELVMRRYLIEKLLLVQILQPYLAITGSATAHPSYIIRINKRSIVLREVQTLLLHGILERQLMVSVCCGQERIRALCYIVSCRFGIIDLVNVLIEE